MAISTEEYLEKNVRGVIEPMVSSLLLEKPKDHIKFMIEWLKNFSGVSNKGPNMELTELQNLRREITKYKKKYAEEDAELEVASQSDVKFYKLIII